MLAGWNDTARAVPAVTLPGLFAAQAARTPDAVAVTAGDTCVTYRELGERAGRVAGFLAGQGIGPEQVVAVVMERSAELVTTLLGIVQAGAAYLPVDPGYPAQRVSFMLADARPALVLADPASAAAASAAAAAGDLPVPVRVLAPADLAPGGPPAGGPPAGGRVAARAPGLRDLHLRVHRGA